MTVMKTIAIAGCGKLGTIVARAAARGLLPDYELIGVYSRTPEKARAAADELAAAGKDCRVAGTFDELLALRPDFIVEAASPKALRQWALPALSQGTSLVCLSIGAFADDAFYDEARTVFSGTAAEAIRLFPTKVNVTVAAARASVGPANLHVAMRSTPGFKGDTQRVEIRNSQVHAVVDVYSATAEIAAWSVVSTLRNIASPIVFV